MQYSVITTLPSFCGYNRHSATPRRHVSRNTPWNLTLYGRIPPLQNLPVGAYSDTLTATILR